MVRRSAGEIVTLPGEGASIAIARDVAVTLHPEWRAGTVLTWMPIDPQTADPGGVRSLSRAGRRRGSAHAAALL